MQLQAHSNHLLTPHHPEKEIYHLALTASSPINYQVGDWLLVKANNPSKLVNAVLKALQLSGDDVCDIPKVGQMTVWEALTQYLELTQLLPATINKFARQFQVTDWPDRMSMMAYADGKDMLDLLLAYPQLNGVDALKVFTPLAPRYYSIASSPQAVGDSQVDLVFRRVQYERAGRQRLGLVSNALSQLLPEDTVDAEVVANPHFKLPELSESTEPKPVIMVAAGTGVAPFIGFLQHRFQDENKAEKYQAWLFFGETSRTDSFIFEADLVHWQQLGLRLNTAFSRDQAEKYYVQHALWENRAEIWRWLKDGAYFYLCGDKWKMASAVEAMMIKIIQAEEKVNEADSSSIWQGLKKSRRVQLDVY